MHCFFVRFPAANKPGMGGHTYRQYSLAEHWNTNSLHTSGLNSSILYPSEYCP